MSFPVDRCGWCGSTEVNPIFLEIVHQDDCKHLSETPSQPSSNNPLLEIKTMSVDGLIIRAAKIASEAHRNQKRKYSGDPYVMHPMRVAGRVILLMSATPIEIAAAWLHDVIEDTQMTEKDLEDRGMPKAVIDYVVALTNPSSRMDKSISRKERKEKDVEHLSKQSVWTKKIKMIDRIDNLTELSFDDASFMALYCQESKVLAEAIGNADENLKGEILSIVGYYESEIMKMATEGSV